MNKEKLGQEPAFAKSTYISGTAIAPPQKGMSKRFYAACVAMQSLSQNHFFTPDISHKEIVKTSYKLADELLRQENESS